MKKVTIVGVGLIGGSIGMDIRRLKLAQEVVGVVRRKESVEEVIKYGSVDHATLDLEEGSKDSDMIILATPISSMPQIAQDLHIKKETVVIDVASVKGKLVEKLESILGKNYVGTHPMTGSEKKGISGARAGLFDGAVCIITPTQKTRPKFLKITREFWTSLGAKTVVLAPDEHDRIVALISHLPHLVSASLVNILMDRPKAVECVGPGFRDSTRIASSPPELWQEICEWNKDEILSSIDKFQRELSDLKAELEANNWGKFLDRLKRAKDIRDGIH